jgi:TolB-like protein/thioredoxin-like negative regulator of GroEL
MGEVYLADDTRLGRPVALKFLTGSAYASSDARARLVREAQVVARLRSPHVAVTYDLVEHEDLLFIAMEYVDGELLSARIARGPLPLADGFDVAMQVAEALDEAHGLGVVHRDIKSGNLMLTPRQLVKVLDFGLAKAVPMPSGDRFRTEAGLTMAGMVVGTLNYMAPEQLRGGTVDHRADLFSLGVVLYEMLAARLPFAGETMPDVVDRILNRRPEPLDRSRLASTLPAVTAGEIDRIVARALEKDPAHRYQTARAFHADLLSIHRSLDGTPASGTRARSIDFADAAGGMPVAPARPARRSVAVLSFANITADAGDDWIGQGIAESLTADLAKIKDLSVVPREQIFDLQKQQAAAGRPIDDRQSVELGRRLGAGWVVSGGYQRLRDRVRITAQALEIPSGRHVATVKIDGRFDDIFDLQDQLVEDLVRKGLERELESSERLALEDDAVVSVEAFEAYSRGMHNLRMASRESTDRAIALFERALEVEPGYVKAMVALGTALDLKGAFLSMPALLERSLDLLRRAIAASPGMAEAHIRLGEALIDLGRLEEGLASMELGLQLEPDNASALALMARAQWLYQGRIDEAIALYRRSLALAPEAGYTHLQLALLHSIRGDLDEAERFARQAVVLQEQAMSGTQGLLVVGARSRLGYVLYLRGQYDDAIREYRREQEFLSGSDHALRERTTIELSQKLSAAHWRKGDRESADAFFERTVEAFDRRLAGGADDPFTRYYMATLYAVRGDAEAARRHIDRPLRDLPAATRWRVSHDRDFDAVRDAAPFRDLLPSP